MAPFTLPTYSGQVLPNGEVLTGLRPPAIQQGGQYNPHAYAQADAMQQIKQNFKPQAYMPWFAQQAPTAQWGKTFNTASWMPPWVMTPGTVGTGGTNLGLGGMFGYQGNYGASPGPGVGSSTTWGGVPNPLTPSTGHPSTGQQPTPTLPGPVTQTPFRPATPNPLTLPTTSGWTGGSTTGQYTGIQTQNPTTPFGTPVYGTPTNTQTQNDQAAREMGNPIPTNTPTNFSGATDFIEGFRFGADSMTGDPNKDLARTTFNKIADEYGHNAAWSWALSDAWGDLAWGAKDGQGGFTGKGLYDYGQPLGDDFKRIVNTYSSASKANYFGDDYRWTTPSRGTFNTPGSAGDLYQQLINEYRDQRWG